MSGLNEQDWYEAAWTDPDAMRAWLEAGWTDPKAALARHQAE